MRHLLDPDPEFRSEVEWRRLLGELVESLSEFTGVRFKPASWFVRDDQPGYASSSNCVDVRGTINPALRLEACGVVCVTVNFKEAAWVSCDLLLFADDRRIRGQEQQDIMLLRYGEEGWSSLGWVPDEFGEWEAHTTDSRWTLG